MPNDTATETATAVESPPADPAPPESATPAATTDDFGAVFARYAGVQRAERSEDTPAAASNGEDDLLEDADETAASDASADGEQPPASNPDEPSERPLTRRGAAAKIAELEARLSEIAQSTDQRVTEALAQRDTAQQELARRQQTEQDMARQAAEHFGDQAEYEGLKSRKARDDTSLTYDDHEKLSRWETNRSLFPAARIQVLGEWAQFVSGRAYALSQSLPGVKAEALEQAVNPDDLFSAFHSAGREAERAELAPKLAAAEARAATAEKLVAQLKVDVSNAQTKAAAAGPRPPSGGTSASPNGTAHLNRRTASAYDLMASGIRQAEQQSRQGGRR